MGSSLWTTLSLALGDSAGVSSAGPSKLCLCLDFLSPKGAPRQVPTQMLHGKVPATQEQGQDLCQAPPFSGEPVAEAGKVTGLMSLLVHVVLSLTAWHHRAHFWNLQALQSTVPPAQAPDSSHCGNSEAAPHSDEELGLWNQT